jgi:hypothetical protein
VLILGGGSGNAAPAELASDVALRRHYLGF